MTENQAKIEGSPCLNIILCIYFRRILGPPEQNSAKGDQKQFQVQLVKSEMCDTKEEKKDLVMLGYQ